MRVLQIISSFPPAFSYGGPARVAHCASAALARQGHDVEVFTTDAFDENKRIPDFKRREKSDGILINRFANISNTLTKTWNLPFAPAMVTAIRKRMTEFDVVHIHEYRSIHAVAAGYCASRYSIPYVLQAHGSAVPSYQKILQKKTFDTLFGERLLRQASAIVAITQTEIGHYAASGVPRSKIHLIFNPIDPKPFETYSDKGRFRKESAIPQNSKVVLYLGRLHRMKGIDILVRAFARLVPERPDLRLVIAGPDDGFEMTLRKLVVNLGIGDSVVFTGGVANPESIYADSDLLVYPAIHEVFGLVPFEAMLSGTPIIVSKDSGCAELVSMADAGYLVEYGNITQLESTIERALASSTKNVKMIARGRAFARQRLAPDAIAQELGRVYENCIHNL